MHRIESRGNDPYLVSPPFKFEGPLAVNLRVRCATGGGGQFFWMTTTAPDIPRPSGIDRITVTPSSTWA